MKNFRKVLVLVLSLAITFTFIPSMAFAAVGDEVTAEAAAEPETVDEAATEGEPAEPEDGAVVSDEEAGPEQPAVVLQEEPAPEETPEISEPADEEQGEKAEASEAEVKEPAAEVQKTEAPEKALKAKATAAPKAAVKDATRAAMEMELDTEYKVSGNDGERSEFTFTPQETGTYKFYSYDIEYGDPYGRIYLGEDELAGGDDEEGSNFVIKCELEKGITYTLAAYGYSYNSYSYSVKLIKMEEITVTYKVTGGYFWYDDNDEPVREYTVSAFKGDQLGYIDQPSVNFESEGSRWAGWALEDDPDNVLPVDYVFEKSETLIGVMADVQNLEAINLDTVYNVKGGRGDYTTFTFTPAVSGDYRFFSQNVVESEPYFTVHQGEDWISDGNGFNSTIYLEENKEYTFEVCGNGNDPYEYEVMLIRTGECTVTFRVVGGYLDNDDTTEVTYTINKGDSLSNIGWPYAYSDDGKMFKGWTLSEGSGIVLSDDYIIIDSVILNAVWGENQDEGEIELDREYLVSGGRGDSSVFTFTPEESGNYRFATVSVDKGSPYGEITQGEEWCGNGYNFSFDTYLEEGRTYTLKVRDDYNEKYSFVVKLRKLEEYTLTFQVTDGYMYDDEGDEVQQLTETIYEGYDLNSVYVPTPTSNDGLYFKGWAMSDDPGTVIGYDHKFNSSVILVPVWGANIDMGELPLDTDRTAAGEGGDQCVFTFTPSENGYYKFYFNTPEYYYGEFFKVTCENETVSSGLYAGDDNLRYNTFYMKEGKEYSLIVGGDLAYEFTVHLKKLQEYTITFEVTDGYMCDDEGEIVQSITENAIEENYYYDINVPIAYSYNGAKFNGWALSTDTETILGGDYQYDASVTLVPVWGKVNDGGTLVLDQEKTAAGAEGEVTTFTYTPSEDGYYSFCSSAIETGTSYGELRIREEGYGSVSDEDNNFAVRHYLEAGETYTFVARDYYFDEYNFKVKLTKLEEITITFKTTEGYLQADQGNRVKEVKVNAFKGDHLNDVQTPSVYSDNWKAFKGWALDGGDGAVLDNSYSFDADTTLVVVWGDVHNGGAIEVDVDENVSGGEDEVSIFTFTPEEDGYYKFYSYSNVDCDPLGELWLGDVKIRRDDSSADNGNFMIRELLEAGREYTFVARDYYYDTYNFNVQVTKVDAYKVTFHATDGYMWNDEGHRTQEITGIAFEGDSFGDVSQPTPSSNSGVGFKGWALEGTAEIVGNDYLIEGPITLIPVWGTLTSKGEIELDTEEIVSGSKGDATSFTFTPEERGYYRFYSYNDEDCRPYAEVRFDGEVYYSDYGFSMTRQLDAGITYTFIARDDYSNEFNYNVKLTKMRDFNVTFRVTDGYMWYEDNKVQERTVTAFEGSTLYDIEVPSAYANNGAKLKGWALETASETVLSGSFEFEDAVVLVPVWGKVIDRGIIALDQGYEVSGESTDKNAFTFTPEEDGYYQFEAYNVDRGEPRGEVMFGEEILDSRYGFTITSFLEEGKTYTYLAGCPDYDDDYRYSVKLTKIDAYTLTFKTDDGYMYDEYNEEDVKQLTKKIYGGQTLSNVGIPNVYDSDKRLKGWALEIAPGTVLSDSYVFESDAVLVPVWGPIVDKGSIELDTEYEVSGNRGDFFSYSFTPSEDGYYRFDSYNEDNCNPYAELRLDGEGLNNDYGFSIDKNLEAGKTYTFMAGCDFWYDSFSYNFKVTKVGTYDVTFKVTDGYMWNDNDEKVHELTWTAVEGWTLGNLGWPGVYSDDGSRLKGWKIEGTDILLDTSYTFIDSVTLVPVWGNVYNKGVLELDEEYVVTGVKGDLIKYSFTPEKSGYYNFCSFEVTNGNPYMEISWDGEKNYGYGFNRTDFLEAGKVYTYAVGGDNYDDYFSYKIKLTESEMLTVTFKVDDGYMKDDDEEIHTKTVTVTEGEYLNDVAPTAYSYSGTGAKGWALADTPGVLLDKNYVIDKSIVVVPVWGVDHHADSIQLDQPYSVSGERGDISSFTFVPEESGWYKFYSYDNGEYDPYGELRENGKVIKTSDDAGDSNFQCEAYLEGGKEYTLIAKGYGFGSYSYKVQLTKSQAIFITFRVTDGYMMDNGEKVYEKSIQAYEGDYLYEYRLPDAYADNEAEFLGWALEGESDVIDGEYVIRESIVLVPVWGGVQNGGALILDKGYNVSLDKNDVCVYTFTPAVSGYYNFRSYDIKAGEPTVKFKVDDGVYYFDYGFSENYNLKAGETYTFIVGCDSEYEHVECSVMISKKTEYTVTFKTQGKGYMWYNYGDENVEVLTRTAYEGESLYDISPATNSYNGATFKGWALEEDPETVLDSDYVITKDITVIAIWGKVTDMGVLELDKEYKISVENDDRITFTFTPSESGYYRFYSYDVSEGEPYGGLYNSGYYYGFSSVNLLEAGQTYTYVVGADNEEDSISRFSVIMTKSKDCILTFKVADGYVYNDDGEETQQYVVSTHAGYYLYNLAPRAHSYDDAVFKGWAIESEPGTVLDNDYIIEDDLTLVAVWGSEQHEGTITAGQTAQVSGGTGDSSTFTFIPDETGYYQFYSFAKGVDDDPYGLIYRDGVKVDENDDCYKDFNFVIVAWLEAGEEYLLTAKGNGSGDYSYSIGIVKAVSLTANANGGYYEYDDEKVESMAFNGATIAALRIPTYEGKNFAGWATKSTAAEPDVSEETVFTTDTTLYAIWADAKSLANAVVSGVTDKTYNGNAQTQAGMTVKYGNNTLVEGEDYNVRYSNNVSAGTATIRLIGLGEFDGTEKTVTFEILPASIAGAAVTLQTGEYIADGATAFTPDVTSVILNGKTLVKDTDYTVSYKDNVNAGTATVTVTGKGNYTGSVSAAFTIKHVHNFELTQTVAPTCTEEGYDLYTCKGCGETQKTVKPATGHKEVKDAAVAPTCTETGLTEGSHCEICGTVIKAQETVPATGHTWDEGKVTREATVEEEGEMTYTCTACGETRTEAIAKLVPPDPTTEMGKDGTAVGEGASAEAAEKAITTMKSDTDPKGSVFGKLTLRQSKVTSTSIKIAWTKVTGAKKYVVYANKCGKTTKPKKITTTTKTTYTLKKIAKKKLTKGTYYKFIVVALDSKGKVVSSSKLIHIATSGGKVGNPLKITTKAKKDRVTVKVKKTFKLAGAYTSSKKLPVKKHVAIRYETSNKKIATVTSKGVIKGIKKGTCYVYVYAQNGLFKKIKVTVKR